MKFLIKPIKILIIIVFSLSLFSCSKNESVLKETENIVDWYSDTLESSIQEAKLLKESMDNRNSDLKETLEYSIK